MRERDVSNGRKWWSLDGRVYHVLSITDMFAGCLKCRVTACSKVRFLFNWQLMKHRAHCQIYTHHLLALYNRESNTDMIRHKQKERERQENVLLCTLLGAYGVKQEGGSSITVGRASPCAVSVFRPLGGNFWAAPSSVRRCIRKQQVKPTARAQTLQYQCSSFRGMLNKSVFQFQFIPMKYSLTPVFPPEHLQGLWRNAWILCYKDTSLKLVQINSF